MFEFARWLGSTPLSQGILAVPWLPQVLLTLHILTIAVVSGSVLMIVLRIHGLARADEPFVQTWSRFFPWFQRALLVMATTGILLFLCEPLREVSALSFWLKMVLIIAGMIGVLALRRRIARTQGAVIPAATRHAAKLVLVIWVTVILLGRAIGYDIPIWGALSLKHLL